jgi:AsmA protein
MVRGPWDDPLLLPDVQVLMKRSGAAAPLLETIRNSAARTQRPSDGECQPAASQELASVDANDKSRCAPQPGR